MEQPGIRFGERLSTERLRFEEVEYAPGHWAERHAHSIGYVDLLLSGAQSGQWAGVEVRRTPGTVALMPPGEFHATSSAKPTWTFQIAVDLLWSEFAEAGRPFKGPCTSFDVGPIAWAVLRMWSEFRKQDDLTPIVLQSQFTQLFQSVSTAGGEERDSARWLRQAKEYVRAHALDGFAVSNLAYEVGVAPAHLMRSYARVYGITLGEDVRRHRVVHACHLLTKIETELAEVAIEAGFTDQSHLNRIFKRHTGLTPREYRSTIRDR